MNPGLLRHRIQIQSRNDLDITAPDVDPFVTPPAPDWTTFYTCWAQIKPLTAKEVFPFSQTSMRVSHKITIRHPGKNVNISAGNQVVYKSRIFSVQTGLINVDELNKEVDILAFEIDPTL